ncbi:MAG: Holliday junction branch migration DNA helicase RuvB [Patescibacteria group bacterium]|jgi:Holliday junction DNA helicase RuvB
MATGRLVSAQAGGEDVNLDRNLRPRRLDEYVGQEKVKKNLTIFLSAAKKRKEPVEHILLHGGPGLGKTTLAHIIAHEMGSEIRVTSGPAIEHGGDLAAILTNLEDGDMLFVDEIHRVRRVVEEMLYPAMEDYALDIVLGKGPSARTMRLELPRFTLIGATTRPNLLSAPLRDRFGVAYRLDFYTPEDMERIIRRSAEILKVDIEESAVGLIARRARWTPRIANRLLKRVRDYAQVEGDGSITTEIAEHALALMDIDSLGLDAMDRRIVEIIIDRFHGGPVGINTIAAAVGVEMDTVEDIYEPFLIQMGFLVRTPRGREVTPSAYAHVGKKQTRDK